jgi:gliding motility-associated-like protein
MYCKIAFLKIVNKVFAVIGLLLVLILFDCRGYAQSLGDPIVNITFGSGSAIHSGPLAADSGSTTYTYNGSGFPNDGYYTIANTTSGMLSTWYTTTDHTGNTGGYMMIVNGSYDPGVFYTRTVQGLCGSTKYQFAAWIKNLLNINGILPNVSFSIETTSGTPLGSGTTGDIAMGNTWIQYAFTFTTPPATQAVVIKMTNNAPGGNGNDIAIDDITFRPYGAQVSAVFNQAATAQSFCAGMAQTVPINATTTLVAGYLQKVQALVNNVWTDQTPASTASSFTITSPTTAGTYYYRLASAQIGNINTSSCVVASNQLTLTVNPNPSAIFAVPVNTCLGSPTIFTDQSVANGGTISSWLWNFGDGQTSTSQNPSHTYAATGNYIIQLTLTNSNGCTTSATPQAIHVSSLPVASFNYSTPDCVTKAVTLTDQSTATDGIITTWLWDYGDGTTDTKQNNQAFQHTYAVTGSYMVKLTITTDKGCSVTSTKNIMISPLPVVNFGTPDVCLADAFALFTDSTTIADNSNSKFTYLWNFGDANASVTSPNTSTLKNPAHKYTQAAIYQVSLTVTSNNGCSGTATKSFTVNGSIPVAAFTVLNPNELCSNREVFFSNQSTVNFGNITKIEMYYDYGNNPTVVETDNAPYYNKLYRHTYPQFHTGTKNYQVRMLAYSGGTCIAVADKTITLLATPLLIFLPIPAICFNIGKVQLTAAETSGIAGSGVYAGTGVSAAGLFDPATSGTGTFAIKYIYTSSNTCADTASQNITVNNIPTANAGTNITVLAGGSANLQGTATGNGLTYSWYPATNLSNSTVLDPMVTPSADIIYTLIVTNNLGCTASSQVTVSVLKSPVIPNTFTPNGDGINDTWLIKYLESYSGATIEVFNRYGQRVYYSIGYPVAWDGRYNNTDVPAGVYYYLINPQHGRKVFSGWVSIIR